MTPIHWLVLSGYLQGVGACLFFLGYWELRLLMALIGFAAFVFGLVVEDTRGHGRELRSAYRIWEKNR